MQFICAKIGMVCGTGVAGVLAPPLLVVIMLIANNRKVMGKRVNGTWTNVAGWTTTALMFAAAIGLFLTWGR